MKERHGEGDKSEHEQQYLYIYIEQLKNAAVQSNHLVQIENYSTRCVTAPAVYLYG